MSEKELNLEKKLHNPTLRVLILLHLIDCCSPEGITLAAISEQLQLPKGTISPILKTLAATGYISYEHAKYRIGYRSFELGLSYGKGSDLLEIIQKQMQELVREVEEISQFGVLTGMDVMYLVRVNSQNPISIISEVGKRIPAYATGLGKALLSLKSDEWLRKAYDGYVFRKIGPKSITSFTELMQAVSEARRTGFAYEREESNEGICCTAVPVCFSGSVQGALSVTAPKFRLTPRKQELIERNLTRTKNLIEEIAKIQGLCLQE